MRKQLKNNTVGITAFFLTGIFLSIFIGIGETLPCENIYFKVTLNIIKNLTSYVFAPFFIGIILLLLPEIWKINEKFDSDQ